MSYENPIQMICSDLEIIQENGALRAVKKCGFTVNKDELRKALEYDRQQYEKGYADGLYEAARLVHCSDCAVPHDKFTGCPKIGGMIPSPGFFCAGGERKDEVSE